MSTLQELYNQQRELGEAIEKAKINFKKDSASRKTLEYYDIRFTSLERKWENFQMNHGKILEYPEAKNDGYLKNGYYEVIEKIYNQMLVIFRDGMNACKDANLEQGESSQQAGPQYEEPFQFISQTADRPTDAPPRPPSKILVSNDSEREYNKESERAYKMFTARKLLLVNKLRSVKNDLAESTSSSGIQLWAKMCEEYWNTFLTSYMEISCQEIISPDDEVQFFAVEDDYSKLVIAMQEKRDKLDNKKSSEMITPKVKPIDIPQFSGKYEAWNTFYDLFNSVIIKNPKLTNVQKMQYLKTSTTGTAAQIISHLHIAEGNFELAWDLLKNRYNNKRLLVSRYFDLLLEQPALNGESALALKSLHDKTKESLNALANMGIKSEELELLVAHSIVKKMDKETHKWYEQTVADTTELQPLNSVLEFIQKRFQTLEALSADNKISAMNTNNKPNFKTATKGFHTSIVLKCAICGGGHKIHECKKYGGMNNSERNDAVRKYNLCRNCLGGNHNIYNCKVNRRCYKCNGRHHTSLHLSDGSRGNERQESGKIVSHIVQENAVSTAIQSHVAQESTNGVLLPTALIKIRGRNNETEIVRALVDQGSMASFVTENVAQRLGLQKIKEYTEISGIGSAEGGISKSKVHLVIKPRYPSSFETTTTALVLPKLTSNLPASKYTVDHGQIKNLTLADPNFEIPDRIDVILGADIYRDIILDKIIRGNLNSPMAQETELGWILSGKVHNGEKGNVVSLITKVNIDDQLKKFWEIEELSTSRKMTSEETNCEEIYQNSTTRDENGRYVVAIPWNKEMNQPLGKSRQRAVATLLQLERRFKRDIKFKKEYSACINEYLSSGHMREVSTKEEDHVIITDGKPDYQTFHLPHHGVVKDSSTTTKLRVVFNASAKSGSGVSLNEKMLVGPSIQEDLISILIRWRKHKIVFTADIEKMYRQIKIREQDANFQRIVWRENDDQPIRDYCLTTVTFGTASAPYLAIKTLQHHADNEQRNFPRACEIIKTDFYVDDLLSGCDTIQEAIELQQQIRLVMEKAGFNLRKWTSNEEEVLKYIPEEQQESNSQFEIKIDKIVKTLGLHWDPMCDSFMFTLKDISFSENPTKRQFISDVSKLFDPLGFLAPVIVSTKILIQDLWRKKEMTWDDPIPQDINQKWSKVKNELEGIQNIRIPRWIKASSNNTKQELHGFCDASLQAYGAVIYMRTFINDDIQVNLVMAKTRVAPSDGITIPRLELCAAALLAKLLQKVQDALKIKNMAIHAWSDSQIVLAWLQGSSSRWKTFVSNRVNEIKEKVAAEHWKYVKSEENPADCASRGLRPNELINHQLWWTGPAWLYSHQDNWSSTKANYTTTMEERVNKLQNIFSCHVSIDQERILASVSSLSKLTKIIALCQRFISNTRKQHGQRLYGVIQTEERVGARIKLIKMAQNLEFQEEIMALQQGKQITTKTYLRSLNPILDSHGILRVGGRLQESEFKDDFKHPIILPYQGAFTQLVISDAHEKTLHGGNQATLTYIRRRYWIISGKRAVKFYVRRCVRCYRFRARAGEQLMGSLPPARTSISKAFTNTGVDFCGPFDVRMSKGRGSKSYKGYISVFICMSTRAIHLELVSDLTADAFLAALRRFIGRRGSISHIYSDNGTNFVGAHKIILKENKAGLKEYNEKIVADLAENEIEWHFIPPASPHFGGLWEAGVKSVKYHLKRVVGDLKLTFEEFNTVLVQIEACLNSRPICPLSEDHTDLTVLTPGHFLTGGPIITPLEADKTEIVDNRLSRWQLCQKLQQSFWQRWKADYLTRLQQRPKWVKQEENIKPGDIVIVRDENTPPTRWPLGRILQTHPGSDDLVRVVTVKTQNGEYRRPITKICLLPIIDNDKVTDTNVKKQTKTSISSNLMLTFVLILGLVTTVLGNTTNTVQPFKIEPIKSNSGLQFQMMGKIQLISDEWKILTFINLTNYHSDFSTIKENTAQLRTMCNQFYLTENRYDEQCGTILPQIQHIVDDMQKRNELMERAEHEPRMKRAVGLIVGAAIGAGVMGLINNVMSKSKAEEYEAHIEKAQVNENHLLQLIKNQTSIVDATQDVMKKTTQLFHKQEIQMENQMAQFQREMQGAYQKIEQVRKQQIWNRVYSYVISLIMNYQRTQDKLLSAITDTTNGKLHPLILGPGQLKAQLKLIRENLPETTKIPEDASEDEILHLYKLLQVKTRIINNKILFEITVPLTGIEDFELIKAISVPINHNGKFVWIEPDSEYLIINLKRDLFYPIKIEQLNQCHVLNQIRLCQQRHPLYNKFSNINSCEVNILNHNDGLHSTCKIRETAPTNIWIQLEEANKWIFVLDHQYTIDIICGNQIFTQKFNDSGTLYLSPNCHLEQKGMVIKAHNTFTTHEVISFVPAHNLSKQLAAFNESQNRPNITAVNSFNKEYRDISLEINQIKENVKTLKTSQNLPFDLTIHDFHHYSIIYVLIILNIIVITYFKCCRQRTVNHDKFFK